MTVINVSGFAESAQGHFASIAIRCMNVMFVNEPLAKHAVMILCLATTVLMSSVSPVVQWIRVNPAGGRLVGKIATM